MFNETVSKAYRILVQKTQAGLKVLGEGLPQFGIEPIEPKLFEAKHLRVGINNQIVELSALGKLLIDKELITWDELGAAYIVAYENEVERLEQEIFEKTGLHVQLDVPPDFE